MFDPKSKGLQTSYCLGMEVGVNTYYIKAETASVYNMWLDVSVDMYMYMYMCKCNIFLPSTLLITYTVFLSSCSRAVCSATYMYMYMYKCSRRNFSVSEFIGIKDILLSQYLYTMLYVCAASSCMSLCIVWNRSYSYIFMLYMYTMYM